jgi:hypothetical protein
MPKLACWSCGRQLYTVAPLDSLFAEERRCPRCGAFLQHERRETERRTLNRRVNPPNDPGPPAPTCQADGQGAAEPEDSGERRVADRRTTRRRAGGTSHIPRRSDPAG